MVFSANACNDSDLGNRFAINSDTAIPRGTAVVTLELPSQMRRIGYAVLRQR